MSSSSSSSSSWKTSLIKFISFQSKPNSTTFPELPDIIIWLRILLATLYGLTLGLPGQSGAAGLMFGLNVVTFVPIVYATTFLGADVDSYKNLYFGGVPNALAWLLLIWIYFFSAMHEDDETILRDMAAKALVDVAKTVVSGGEDGGDGAAETVTETASSSSSSSSTADSEF